MSGLVTSTLKGSCVSLLENAAVIMGFLLVLAVQFSHADRVFKYPRVQQERDQWCWSACSQWIIGFHGTELTQTEICRYGFIDGQVRNEWNYIYTPTENGELIKNNVYGRGINWVIAHWGVTWKVKNGFSARYTLTETEFGNEIENGHPFVIRYNWDNNNGHFVVAMGYQNHMCWIMNPWKNDGIQIYDYQWIKDNINGPLQHHVWDYSLQTTRVDTVPELTTAFPASLPAIGERISLALTSTLNGRDVTKCTFFTSLTAGVNIDSATRTISWTQTAQGPATITFAREFGNARDTITRSFSNVPIDRNLINGAQRRATLRNTGGHYCFCVSVPSNCRRGATLSLYSAKGTRVLSHDLAGSGCHMVYIRSKTFSRGMYLLHISNGSQQYAEKLIF